jgi:hypothetical protein
MLALIAVAGADVDAPPKFDVLLMLRDGQMCCGDGPMIKAKWGCDDDDDC